MTRVSVFLVLLLGLARLSLAQCPGVTTQLTPFAKETLTVSDTAKALTASIYKPSGTTASMAVVSVRGGTVHYEVIGTPTVNDGHPLLGGATLTICGIDSIAAFKAIRLSTDALLSVTYYKTK